MKTKKITEKKSKKLTTKKATFKKKLSKKLPVLKSVAKKARVKSSPLKKYQGEEAFLASVKPYKINKKEKYMCAKQKNHFKKILYRWREMLQFEQDRTADKIQNNISHFADEGDRATHEEGFALEIRTRERERNLLSKIFESTEDLNNGNYGYCINPNCGVEIGIRRLEARPTANLCIDCKTLEEIKEKQQYG
uniref:RNA polymerase-binding transcription factor DksA n=1 Tax=uncultured gamma proteobacterium HF4000_19M20 TaxID=710987 RepID=E0XVS6_9GAMM|nr:dnaK suppressor protein [uncultured gamma proteobacterium HF4000_19M20]